MKQNRNTYWGVLCTLFVLSAVSHAEELAGYWRLDQKGGEFECLGGSSGPAKVQPAGRETELTLVPDEIGRVKETVEFNGSGNYWISTPANVMGDGFTIELWIKVDDRDQKAVVLGNRSGIVVAQRPHGELVFLLASGVDGAAWSYAGIPDVINVDKWIHVMARFSENTQQLFVDDGNTILRSKPVTIENPKQFVWPRTVLGINDFDQTEPFRGRIAALKIYDGALSEEDFKKSTP